MVVRTRRPSSTAALVAAVLAVGLGLSACGDRKVKTGDIERTITTQFARQGVVLRDVSCEDGVDAKVGTKLSCTAENRESSTLQVQGTVTAVKDDKVALGYRILRGTAKGSVVAADLRERLQRQRGQASKSVTCPDEIALPTRKPVVCTTTTPDGKRYDTSVTIDVAHRIAFRLARTPQR